MKVKVQLERDEDGYWIATVPSLPGCISQGRTKLEAQRNVREAIELHLSSIPSGDTSRKGPRAVEIEVAVKS